MDARSRRQPRNPGGVEEKSCLPTFFVPSCLCFVVSFRGLDPDAGSQADAPTRTVSPTHPVGLSQASNSIRFFTGGKPGEIRDSEIRSSVCPRYSSCEKRIECSHEEDPALRPVRCPFAPPTKEPRWVEKTSCLPTFFAPSGLCVVVRFRGLDPEAGSQADGADADRVARPSGWAQPRFEFDPVFHRRKTEWDPRLGNPILGSSSVFLL
jgi:hypothetical protein